MIKHFILNLNPNADYEWERCSLHHPITAEQPNFADLIAQEIREFSPEEQRSQSYLIAVKLEVTVLEGSITESMAERVPEMVPNSFPVTISRSLMDSNRGVRNLSERIPEYVSECVPEVA